MRLAQLGEVGLIDRIRALAGSERPPVKLGIGDDAALIAVPGGEDLVVSTDGFAQGVHFDFRYMTPELAGARCATAALSDLAAMAARPLALFLQLVVPRGGTVELAEGLVRGICGCAEDHGLSLAGGDTIAGPERWIVSLTAIGSAEPYRIARRAGAEAGDELWVTGDPGWSAIGLELLTGAREMLDPYRALAIERFLRPRARCREARWLTERGLVKAMIDISDGLAGDLGRLCAASGVGANLSTTGLPESLLAAFGEAGAWQAMLTSGEEFELLLAAPPGRIGSALAQQFAAEHALKLRRLGTITSEPGLRRPSGQGRSEQIEASGYDHFLRR